MSPKKERALERLRVIYESWVDTPFPEIGKDIDGYPEYNSDLAGIITRVIGRERLELDEMPDLGRPAREAVAMRVAGVGPDVEELRRNEASLKAFRTILTELLNDR
jgi:hypothetical protein